MSDTPCEIDDDEDGPPEPPCDPLVPRNHIYFLVERMFVWTPDAEVRDLLLSRMTDPGWTDELKEQAVAYGLYWHHQHQALCRHFRL